MLTQRVWIIDFFRVLSIVAIILAHTAPLESSYLFWLCNTLAPIVFVLLIGVSRSLSSKTPLNNTIYGLYLIALGLILGEVHGEVITVLPTLGVILILMSWVKPSFLSVAAAWAFYAITALLGARVPYIYPENQWAWVYTLDIRSLEASVMDSVYAFTVTGAYALNQWLPVAYTAGFLWSKRDGISRVGYSHIWGSAMLAGLLSTGYAHVKYHPWGAVSYNHVPSDMYGDSYLELLTSPHTHSGSVAPLMYGALLAVVVCLLSDLSITARVPLADMSLSMYVVSVIISSLFPEMLWENTAIVLLGTVVACVAFKAVFKAGPFEKLGSTLLSPSSRAQACVSTTRFNQ